jgi:RimJ/RimL family protein N-acetyltransferase
MQKTSFTRERCPQFDYFMENPKANYTESHPDYCSLEVLTYTDGHLRLIEPNLDHAEASVPWTSDSQVTQYMGGDFDLPSKEKEVERLLEIINNQDEYNWMIELNGQLIGNVHVDSIAETSAKFSCKAGNFGILIGDRKFWGKGIGQHVTSAVLEWAFSKGGFIIISSRVLNENTPSINLHKKFGFEYVSQSPYEGQINGKSTEWQNFKITKHSFQKLKKK